MKQKRITIRLDDWTSEQLDKVCELTGANQSIVVRAMCLQFLNKKKTNVNGIQELVNNPKNKDYHIRIDENLRNKIASIALKSNKTAQEVIRGTLYDALYSVECEEYYVQDTRERRRKAKTTSIDVMEVIGSNYEKIRSSIISEMPYNNDVFQDTIIEVSEDPAAEGIKSKGEAIAFFKRKYNMLMYRYKKERNQRKEIEYADYLQAKETI